MSIPEALKPLPGTLLSLHMERHPSGGVRVVARASGHQHTTVCMTAAEASDAFARFAADPITAAVILGMFRCGECNAELSVRRSSDGDTTYCYPCENTSLATLARTVGK